MTEEVKATPTDEPLTVEDWRSKIPSHLLPEVEPFIGRKVLILPNHPHADRVGIVDSFKYTWAGWGFEVRFPEGDGCFVFEGKFWRMLNQ